VYLNAHDDGYNQARVAALPCLAAGNDSDIVVLNAGAFAATDSFGTEEDSQNSAREQ
jgi:hypothetical protein